MRASLLVSLLLRPCITFVTKAAREPLRELQTKAFVGHSEEKVPICFNPQGFLAKSCLSLLDESLFSCASAEVGDVVVAGQSAIPYLQDTHLQLIRFCPSRACTSELASWPGELGMTD